MENENYQELANAIIIRAAKDYRILLRYHQKHPGNAEIERRINKLEREIPTPFFQSLTKLNVDEIFSAIKSGLKKQLCKRE